jgi:hypothetical protein
MLKRLRLQTLTIPWNLFLIVERTYNVLGRGFSHRKVY